MNKTQTPTLERVSKLRTELRVLVNDDLKPNNKTVYNSRINKFRDELDEIGISKELTLREAERSVEKWFEKLSNPQKNQTPTPEYVTNTTLTSEQIENFNKDLERARKSEEIRARQKTETERFKKRGEEIFTEKQRIQNEKTKLSEEDLDNLTKVFSMLLKWDMEQNPHLYKKKNPTEINKENPVSIMSENSKI